jgi:hypothetical protein
MSFFGDLIWFFLEGRYTWGSSTLEVAAVMDFRSRGSAGAQLVEEGT